MSLPVKISSPVADAESKPFSRLENIKHDAGMGSRYATQLLELWDEHLHQKLSSANHKAAVRFRTLMVEICSATDRVSMQLEKTGESK